VAAFGARATDYDQGWLGRWHAEVAARTCAVAGTAAPNAHIVVDIGCGTGQLLRLLSTELGSAVELTGVDPATAMIETARLGSTDERLKFVVGAAELLPMADATVDLVVSTTSFDHWHDQRTGLRECRRILRPDGRLVLADLITPLLWPTTVVGRRGKARTPRRVTALLADSGLRVLGWQSVGTMIHAVTAATD
jgi:ubiquinone/menaquinone biosynthesis C-methylase UbiE